MCGFWDGSFENGTCGSGIMILVFTQTLGWVPLHTAVQWSELPGCRAQQVWNDEDDPRKWLEDEEGNELFVDGEGVKEDLEGYLMKHLIYKLETYLVMGGG